MIKRSFKCYMKELELYPTKGGNNLNFKQRNNMNNLRL